MIRQLHEAIDFLVDGSPLGRDVEQKSERFAVFGSCMDPLIPRGAHVLVESLDARPTRTGDVLAHLDHKGAVVVHRVIRIERTGDGPVYITRGDWSDDEDRLPSSAAVYRVIRVESDRFGYGTQSPVGRCLALVTVRLGALPVGSRVALRRVLRLGRRLVRVLR